MTALVLSWYVFDGGFDKIESIRAQTIEIVAIVDC